MSLLHMSQWVSKKSRGGGGGGDRKTANKEAAAAMADAEGLEAAAAYEASQSASQMDDSQVEELCENNTALALDSLAASASAPASAPAPTDTAPAPAPAPASAVASAAPPPPLADHEDSTLEEQVGDLLSGVEEAASAQHESTIELPAQSAASSSSSHLQQASTRLLANSLCNTSELREQIEQTAQPNQEHKQADVPAAATAATPPQPGASSSLPLATPLLIAHVLDELLPSNRSRFSDSILRGLGHKLGHAVKRSETVRQRKDTLLQQDLHTAAASIQRAMRKILNAAHEVDEVRSTSIFLESLGRACPPLVLWCVLRQLDGLICLCMGPSSAATVAAAAELAAIDRLDLLERACLLCRLMERILDSTNGVASLPSAYTTMLSAFGLDWQQIWSARFCNSSSGHLLSGELEAIAPMLRAYLWQILERMHPLQQASTIDAMQGNMDDK